MSVIKCKMCGGDLELIEGSSVAVCEYCGSQQTIPAADNEKKLTLFARANRLRLACEFDKSAGVYESIVADFPTEAEAYWGLVLCRYGIEYVDDPATGKKIPTCHRSSFDSVMEDNDFEQALENADAVARRVYRDEAKAIEELRRGIVEVSGKEPPYDIFICYKETAEDGQRTVDSVIAQDVYDALTEKGYRVFFSRISLEDKLGTEYEPYIFAALHSAKIMLAFGTDYEYYNAVWVKNEWSRFLQLMTKDKSKHLIPCYKGIDAYDMPKEFAKLQAQDMGKVGAMQDLLRGVDKIMGKGAGAAPAADTTAAPAPTVNPTVTSLLERAEMFLADGDWDNADTYCERTLDIEPKNSTAYLYKLMADLEVSKKEDLENCTDSFDTSNNYQKAIRFGDEALRNTLEGYITHIKQRKEDEENRKREARLNGIYTAAQQRMSGAKNEADYRDAAKMFAEITDYKDAEACGQRAEKLAEEARLNNLYKTAVSKLENAINEPEFFEGIKILDTLGDYKDSAELKTRCEEDWRSRKEVAMAIWKEYCTVNDRILSITKEIEERSISVEKLKENIKKAQSQLREIKNTSEQITSLEAQLEKTQQHLAQTNKELSSLGVFAFSKKKELAARMKELTDQASSISDKISQAKKFISKADTVDVLQASISDNERKIAKRDGAGPSEKSLNAELMSLQEQLAPIAQKLNNRQIIATLAQDEKILPLLVDEYSIAMTIKADDELRYMLKNSELFYMLPKDRQKLFFGMKGYFDTESVYYQACQAMDGAQSIEDIKWARGEFAAIKRYKDSAQRLARCDEMIAKNTYK